MLLLFILIPKYIKQSTFLKRILLIFRLDWSAFLLDRIISLVFSLAIYNHMVLLASVSVESECVTSSNVPPFFLLTI